MPVANIIILLAAWITSLGLLGVLVLAYAQADAAQEKTGERMRFEPTRAAAPTNGRVARLKGEAMERDRYLGAAR